MTYLNSVKRDQSSKGFHLQLMISNPQYCLDIPVVVTEHYRMGINSNYIIIIIATSAQVKGDTMKLIFPGNVVRSLIATSLYIRNRGKCFS